MESIKDKLGKPISLFIDGTYKLVSNRWVLLVLSYQIVTINSKKELCQSAFPFLFALCYSESKEGVEMIINSFKIGGIYISIYYSIILI